MAEKNFEKEDPLERVRMVLDAPADDSFYDEMARTFIEEYMKLGYSDAKILYLFREPFYQGTHEILKRKGETFVKNLIREVRHG